MSFLFLNKNMNRLPPLQGHENLMDDTWLSFFEYLYTGANMTPLKPIANGSIANVTTSSQSITNFTAGVDLSAYLNAEIKNDSGQTVFVKFTTGAGTATSSDIAVPAGAVLIYNKDATDTVSILGAAAGGSVYVSIGTGV
jgi:hypothetical protein